MTVWRFQRYGSIDDPIHKSHLNALTGDYGCPRAFRFARDAQAAGRPDDEAAAVSGRAAAGTATHETIARALAVPELCDRILSGGKVSHDAVSRVYWDEWDREVDGRAVRWRDDDKPDAVHADRVTMIHGLLGDMHRYVARVELVEAGFIVLCGEYWLSGHIDLVYRPRARPNTIALADWKTGASKPTELELDHGWEAGVYSAAVHGGLFLPREQLQVSRTEAGRARVTCGAHTVEHASRYIAERDALERALIDLGRATMTADRTPAGLDVRAFGGPSGAGYPSEIYHVALSDYVPYQKAGRKAVKRPEDLRFHGYDSPRSHAYKAGDRRGPAWLPVRVTEHDIPRLQSRLRNVVGMVRMGRFIDQVGEKCRRCPWADDCLSSGYAPRGDDRAQLERHLRVLDADAAADADALSLD